MWLPVMPVTSMMSVPPDSDWSSAIDAINATEQSKPNVANAADTTPNAVLSNAADAANAAASNAADDAVESNATSDLAAGI
jgi:hypothetical protein